MGKRGPAKTSNKILKMRGSPLAKGRKGEPKPAAGVPKPPKWLKGEALKEWKRVVPELAAIGLLAFVDQAALAAMCQAWADYLRNKAVVDAEGDVVTNNKGMKMKHPAVNVMEGAFNRWQRLMKEFGLTPAARANMAIEKKNPEENRGKGRFFKGG